MIRSVFFAFLALSLIVSAIAPAVAAEKKDDFWHLSNFTNPHTQRFEYCAVESGFDNGMSLAFARNRDYYTNIIVGFAEPKLELKTKYRLLVGIDGHAPTEITGFAADEKALVVPVQKDKKVLAQLRSGNLLEIKGPQDAIKFSLNGAAKAFDQLQDCIDKSLKEEKQKAPVPTSAPAKEALAELSEATPGGELAGEVEPLPLPKQPPPTPGREELANPPASIMSAPQVAAPTVQPQPVELPVPVIADATPVIALPPAVTVPVVQPQVKPAEPEVMPVKPREPVQATRLDTVKPVAVLPPQQMAAVEPAPQPEPLPAPKPEPVASSPALAPVPPPVVTLPPAQPAPVVQAPSPAAAKPEPVAQALESAPYDQIIVVPDTAPMPARPPVIATGAPSPAVLPVQPYSQPQPAPVQPPAVVAPPSVAQSQPVVVAQPAPAMPTAPQPVIAPPVVAVVQPVTPQPAPAVVRASPPAVVRPVAPHAFPSLELSAVLASLGIDAKQEKSGKKGGKFYWHDGDLTGTAMAFDTGKPFLDRMLGQVDAMEKSCRAAFSSDLGAPVEKARLVYAEAIIGCGAGPSAIQGTILFYQAGGKFVVFTEQGQVSSRSITLQRRENLKNDLLLSTNYK